MYFVGIDISKFKHDCAIIDELGDVITPSRSFQNDCEGFSLLKELLDALNGEKKIGFEATGHYGQNLKLFLENNGFSFMEFNPLLINQFVRSKSLRKTKTDSIDALTIAQYLMTVEYKPYPPSFYTLEKLIYKRQTLQSREVGHHLAVVTAQELVGTSRHVNVVRLTLGTLLVQEQEHRIVCRGTL